MFPRISIHRQGHPVIGIVLGLAALYVSMFLGLGLLFVGYAIVQAIWPITIAAALILAHRRFVSRNRV